MNITPSLIIDGLLLVVLLMGGVKGFKEGFFTSAIRLMGSIGSVLGGLWLANTYSDTVFVTYLRQPLIERSYSYLTQTAQNIDIETAITGVLGSLPQEFLAVITDKAQGAISGVITPDMNSATLLVDQFLAPIATTVVSVVIFLIAYTAIRLVCNMMAWLFKAINNVPLLGTANKLAGFAVGGVTGAINIILLSLIMSIIVMVTGDNIPFLNSQVLQASRIIAMTSTVNPFIM